MRVKEEKDAGARRVECTLPAGHTALGRMRGTRGTRGARATLLLLLAAGQLAAADPGPTSTPLDTIKERSLNNADPSLEPEVSTAKHIRSADFTSAGYETTESDLRLGSELHEELQALDAALQQDAESRRNGLSSEYLTSEGQSLAPDDAPLRSFGGAGNTYFLRKAIPSNELVFLDTIYGAENLIRCTRDGQFYRLQTPWKQCLVCVCVQGGRPACTVCGDCAAGALPVPLGPSASAALSTALLDSLLPTTTIPPLPIPLQPVPVKPIAPISLQSLPEIQPFQTFPTMPVQKPLMPLKIVEPPNQPQPVLVLPTIPETQDIPELSVGGSTSCSPLPTGVAFGHPLNPCKTCLCQAPADGQTGVRITCIDNHECVNPISVPEIAETQVMPKPIPLPYCNKFPKNVIFPHPTDSCRQCQCFAILSAFAIAQQQILCIPTPDCKTSTPDILQPSYAIQQDQRPTLPLSVPDPSLNFGGVPSEQQPIIPLFVESIPTVSSPTFPIAIAPELSNGFDKPSFFPEPPETEPAADQPNLVIGQFPNIQDIPALPIRPYDGPPESLLVNTVPPPSLLDLLPPSPLKPTELPTVIPPIRPAVAVEPPQGSLSVNEQLIINTPPKLPQVPQDEPLNPEYLALFPELKPTENVVEPVTDQPLPWPPIKPTVPKLPIQLRGPLPGPPPHKSCQPYPPNTPFQHPWDECKLCQCSEYEEDGHSEVEVNCFTKPSCCIEFPTAQGSTTAGNEANKIMYTEPRCQARPLDLPFVLGCEVCVCVLRPAGAGVFARCTPQPKCAGRLTSNGESPISSKIQIPVNGALQSPVSGTNPAWQKLLATASPGWHSLHPDTTTSAFPTGQVQQRQKLLGGNYSPASFPSSPQYWQNYAQNSPIVPIKTFAVGREPSALTQMVPSASPNYQRYPSARIPQSPSNLGQSSIGPQLLHLLRGLRNHHIPHSSSLYSGNRPPGTPRPLNHFNDYPPSAPSSAVASAVAEASTNSLHFRASPDLTTTITPKLSQREHEELGNTYPFQGSEPAAAPTTTWLPVAQNTDTTTGTYNDLTKKSMDDGLLRAGDSSPISREGRGLCQFAGDAYHARCRACTCHLDDRHRLYSMCYGNPCH